MEQAEHLDAVVIGAGPVGLMAAEALAAAGRQVTVFDGKPSPARKLLMAGKSGLNLTRDETTDQMLRHYGAAAPHLAPMLERCGARDIRTWAEALGQPLFVGPTKRVFPTAMKAAPLLRAWLGRLAAQGAQLRVRHRFTGWDATGIACFETPDGPVRVQAAVTVLALGGASWARLGSDGRWTAALAGTPMAPFAPANVGLDVAWSAHMARHMGAPVKAIALHAGEARSRGEIVVSTRGLEGGGLYPLTPALRDGAALTLDLLPDLAEDEVARRLARPRGKASLATHLRKVLRLDPVRIALAREWVPDLPAEPAPLAGVLKALPVRHRGLRPMDEAISTAGGIRFEALDPTLMLRDRPGVFAAGEMLDWEAPTGGYLLTGCFATGLWAGRNAALWS